MDHNDDHAARRRCGARNHAPSAGVRALSLRIETRLGPNINLIIIVFIKRPLEISKDRWTDRSVPAETGGRTGSSEPKPVKKTGAPRTLRRSLNKGRVPSRVKWELRCKVEKRACRAPGVRGGPPGCPPPGLSTKGHLDYAWARAARAPWRDSVHVPADAREVAAHVGRRDRAQSRREREPRARSRKRAVVAQARLHLRDSTRRAASRSGTRSCCGSR